MSTLLTESSASAVEAPSLIGLLLEIHREKKSGLLHLMDGSRLASVWFMDGSIRHADGLKDVLKGVAPVDPPGGFSGDLMVDLGGVIAVGVSPEAALRAAHVGIVQILVRVGLNGSVGWGFQENAAAPPGSVTLPGSLMKGVIQSIEGHEALRTVEEQLKEMGQHALHVEGQILPQDGFPPVALRVYRLAAKGTTLDEVIRGVGGDESRAALAWKSVALLQSMGLIRLTDAPMATSRESKPGPEPETTATRTEGATPSSTHSSSPRRARRSKRASSQSEDTAVAAGPSVPDDPDALFKKAAEVEAMNPLLAIGLDPEEVSDKITPDRVRAAFRKEATVYHPDRLADLSSESREAAEAVFSAFNELRNHLSTQKDIDLCIKTLLQQRSGIKEITEFDRERARVMGRKAAGFMRHRKWQPALELIRQAKALDPENVMLTLWERFTEGILKEVPYEKAAKFIEDLQPEGKKNQAERLYRSGWLWKLAGKEKQAMRCFKAALDVVPSHMEAQSELRVLQKRHPGTSDKPESNIPFARFFKKK